MKKYDTPITVMAVSCLLVCGLFCSASGQQPSGGDYEKLKREYDALLIDRNNLLIQGKNLLEYKAKYLQVEDSIKQMKEEKEKTEKELQARLEQNSLLQQKIEELEGDQKQLQQDKDSLKNSLEKIEIEYRIVPETRKEISRLQKENADLLRQYKQSDQKLKAAGEHKLDADAQVELYRRQVSDAKKGYEQAMEKNRMLEKKNAEMPKRLAEMARENKVLIKETSMMHYNLGVFYVQNKEFPRAIAEFEKAIELNPDDAYAHYNLGYIYAEYVVDRTKAIENFRQFLRLTKNEDKDVEWVKNYILTWQTWEGKNPAK